MRDLALKVLDYYHTEGMYSATKNPSGSVTVNRLKLSTSQYVQMKAAIIARTNNGLLPVIDKMYQNKAKQDLEQLQIIWGTMK